MATLEDVQGDVKKLEGKMESFTKEVLRRMQCEKHGETMVKMGTVLDLHIAEQKLKNGKTYNKTLLETNWRRRWWLLAAGTIWPIILYGIWAIVVHIKEL